MEIPFQICENIRRSRIYSAAAGIVRRLKENGHSAYLVGGAVRDLFLGKKPKDYDITTSAVPAEIMTLFPQSIPIGASFGVITVVVDSMNFEVATYREERDYEDGRRPETLRFSKTPEEDVARRDFTINALLFDPEHEIIRDETGGISDLRRGVLRTIGNPDIRFSEDYLRMLRAVRFAVRLQMNLDPAASEAIRRLVHKLQYLSSERVRDELTRILCGPMPDQAFRAMAELGILKILLPEVDAMQGVEQPPDYHPEGDVFEHTVLMLGRIAWATPEIGWSVLLHDIGKPCCKNIGTDGRIHFYSHEEKGARMAEDLLARLKMPSVPTAHIISAVRNHMRFASVDRMRSATWRRMMADPNFPLELELHRIDCSSCHGKMNNYLLMLDRMHELETANLEAVPKPFLTGKDLMKMGVRPGPRLGKLLRYAADLQLDGIVTTREEAKKAMKDRLIYPEDQDLTDPVGE